VCIVGKKKSGKTTTTVGLVEELVRRGHLVMTAKHGHGFELDHGGTDSWRHRHEGGAHRVAMVGPAHLAVVGGWGSDEEPTLERVVARYLSEADIVVAEGFKRSSAQRIEVYRRQAHARPLYGEDPAADALYLAILTDAVDFEAHVPVMDLHDPRRFETLADLIEARFLGEGSRR